MGLESTKVRCFQDLRVWQIAHELALSIYRLTQDFPREERYGLTSQIRRAVVSISANIAEGSKRPSTRDLCHFLDIAQGSNEEVKCLLLLSRDLHYLPADQFGVLFEKSEAVGAMLNGLLQSLKSP
jgi:four helix bundle protein